jgi:hypothetical protein
MRPGPRQARGFPNRLGTDYLPSLQADHHHRLHLILVRWQLLSEPTQRRSLRLFPSHPRHQPLSDQLVLHLGRLGHDS